MIVSLILVGPVLILSDAQTQSTSSALQQASVQTFVRGMEQATDRSSLRCRQVGVRRGLRRLTRLNEASLRIPMTRDKLG